MTIQKVKTFHGLKYAVVEPFTSTVVYKDKDGKKVSKSTTEMLSVEYKSGDKVLPAIFDVTPEGLAKAKEVLEAFKK